MLSLLPYGLSVRLHALNASRCVLNHLAIIFLLIPRSASSSRVGDRSSSSAIFRIAISNSSLVIFFSLMVLRSLIKKATEGGSRKWLGFINVRSDQCDQRESVVS